jgi:hypothetical protein
LLGVIVLLVSYYVTMASTNCARWRRFAASRCAEKDVPRRTAAIQSFDVANRQRLKRKGHDACHLDRDDEAIASQSSFGGIVGETHATVFKEQSKVRPSLQDLIERFDQPRELGELFRACRREGLSVKASSASGKRPDASRRSCH